MVKYDTVLIRYGELSTKGKNRKDFIRRLERNIRNMFSDFKDLEYRRTHDRIYIHLHDEDPAIIKERLEKVFGISSFSFTEKVDPTIEAIQNACLEIAKTTEKKTFKMVTKRHDKTFPMISDEINRAVAGVILRNTDLKVDVHNPELMIRTSGELRISNFLLWQLSYSEFYVTDTLWPDFGKEEFAEALAAYRKRERRFGGRLK